MNAARRKPGRAGSSPARSWNYSSRTFCWKSIYSASGITSLRDENARADLELVPSAVLVKLSRKSGDTAKRTTSPNRRRGLRARPFMDKTREFVERFTAFNRLLPKPPPVRLCYKTTQRS